MQHTSLLLVLFASDSAAPRGGADPGLGVGGQVVGRESGQEAVHGASCAAYSSSGHLASPQVARPLDPMTVWRYYHVYLAVQEER